MEKDASVSLVTRPMYLFSMIKIKGFAAYTSQIHNESYSLVLLYRIFNPSTGRNAKNVYNKGNPTGREQEQKEARHPN